MVFILTYIQGNLPRLNNRCNSKVLLGTTIAELILMANKPIIWLGLFKSDGRLSGKCVEVRTPLKIRFKAGDFHASHAANDERIAQFRSE